MNTIAEFDGGGPQELCTEAPEQWLKARETRGEANSGKDMSAADVQSPKRERHRGARTAAAEEALQRSPLMETRDWPTSPD